jgi:hypothetical protein
VVSQCHKRFCERGLVFFGPKLEPSLELDVQPFTRVEKKFGEVSAVRGRPYGSSKNVGDASSAVKLLMPCDVLSRSFCEALESPIALTRTVGPDLFVAGALA